jgi:hypothetical protein
MSSSDRIFVGFFEYILVIPVTNLQPAGGDSACAPQRRHGTAIALEMAIPYCLWTARAALPPPRRVRCPRLM